MDLARARVEYLEWLEVGRNPSHHTIRAYGSDLRLLERHLGPTTPVARMTAESLFTFVEHQRRGGLSVRTVKRRACAIRGFCGWLTDQGLVEADPWAEIRLDLRAARTLPRPVPRHDLRRLLAHLAKRAQPSRSSGPVVQIQRLTAGTTLVSVVLMVATGMRVGEVVAVQERDLDLMRAQIRVHGKGARERVVYLTNEWAVALVGEHLRQKERLGVTTARLLFNQSGEPMTTAALRMRLAAAARSAGISQRITPHMLRHTAATELVEAGVNIRYVQRLLGHASLSTTEIYTHVADDSLRQVIAQADVIGRTLELIP